MWKKFSIKKRIVILMVFGLIIGGFIQGEVDNGTFPGIFTVVGVFIFILACQQGWKDGAVVQEKEGKR